MEAKRGRGRTSDGAHKTLLGNGNDKENETMRYPPPESSTVEDVMDLQGDVDVRNVREAIQIPMEEIAANRYNRQSEDLKKFFDLEWDKSCFMRDGKRQIDFVLAFEEEDSRKVNGTITSEGGESSINYETDSEDEEEEHPAETSRTKVSHREKREFRRKYYEGNLEKMGLELERVEISPTLGRTRFTLVHAPFNVLERQAQLLSVKLPIMRNDVYFQNRKILPGPIDNFLNSIRVLDFDDETKKLLDEPEFFSAPYSSDRRQQFVNWDRPEMLFPVAERCRMVYDLLTRAHYDKNAQRKDGGATYRFGIERLLASYTYTAAFPLHQELRSREEIKESGQPGATSQREMLYLNWASWRNVIKYQPLDAVKRYFGTKVAFYFAWLGYYTKSLYWAALVGVICVAYGLIRMNDDVVSNDICGTDGIGAQVIVCPQCETYCDYQRLNSSCLYAKMTYLFDNGMTVIFAALMSVWATLFLEGWKRYHAEIAWKWGLLDFVVEEDSVRPDFQRKSLSFLERKNWPTFLPLAPRSYSLFVSFSPLFFGMVVYRVICMRLLASMDNPVVDSLAFVIVSFTAATINLIVIMFMNYFYSELALWLTAWECPRTQSDFDNSYTFKVFLFQFVNYYSSLFYVAFFKGLLAQVPGARDDSGNVKIAGYRLEGCDPAGCFVELFIQLATIMCGRQFFSASIEFAYPKVMALLRKWQLNVPQVVETKEQRKQRIHDEARKKEKRLTRWEADYYLNPTYDQFLFDEYLEMVLQFGFVTLFVAAFPLAPLFAVLNNIMEIRLDAYKFLVTSQKPIPLQGRNIGVWFEILDVISRMSVTINALVIAFTSDFVPKTLYWFSNNHSMIGYVNSSLSYYDANNFDVIMRKSQFPNVDVCRFRGYRKTPCSLSNVTINNSGSAFQESCDDGLGLSYEWWKVLAVRLLFVVIFEHVVFLIKVTFEYLIADVPAKIFVQQQREKYLLRKALLSDIASATESSRKSTYLDSEDVAFQPGAFEHEKIEGVGTRFRAPLARASTSLDSYETAFMPEDAWRSSQQQHVDRLHT
ncbi:unnamed protein product [Caenorhabditis auriculariae]|uniref:Anoctamin n=1 Tax=Caenorhabditis auriculariae TaxID=2777116 RepID=A0A8S1H853_9PELO|nr:unnamed protein product [Caenorhabditis auriculariae]